jgi:hypothetical protein
VTLGGLIAADRPKKQGTRMLKAECLGHGCGYTVRVAARWIADCGPPHCPKHGPMHVLQPLAQDVAAAAEEEGEPIPPATDDAGSAASPADHDSPNITDEAE